MRITVVSNINAKSFLKQLGLTPGGPVQRMLVSECARHMDKYTPMQSGTMKNTRIIQEDGVLYDQPGARYQYLGQLMLASNGSAWAKLGERKHLAEKALNYHGAPMRGSHWDVRMWADKRREILEGIARKMGGKAL